MNQITLVKRMITLVCAGFYISALAGCTEGTYEDPYIVGNMDNDYSWSYVKLPDGRRVPCITGNSGAITCDWAHADGADQERTQ
ncbi:hypothetical protein BBIA_2166 [Bifidobacterium biavatii DSM 23969]|uniref:Lipoprotein n=1 Tax=Bifidobacterium biavatii DSM 23969 TaxID=1437608 RepID=A0A086ZU33_9BIFI|nr:hypothetical protein BBIA_2166 [Bifidobacterium biavatii DSM 23969]